MEVERRSQLIKILTTAEPVVLDFEDPKAYQQLIQLFVDDIQPSSSLETALVVELANCQWQLKRVRALETGALITEYDWVYANEPERAGIEPKSVATTRRSGAAALRAGETLKLLERFEANHQRAFFRVLEELRRLRKPPKPAAGEPQAEPEPPHTSVAQNRPVPASVKPPESALQPDSPAQSRQLRERFPLSQSPKAPDIPGSADHPHPSSASFAPDDHRSDCPARRNRPG